MELSILFAGIALSLWGTKWARAITFVVGETIALVWLFMLQLLGAGIAGIYVYIYIYIYIQ
jgi:hypothetical protein